jgi:hypothetical protein
MRLLKQPWLHFILLGVGLFLLQGWLFPEPKPVIGPIAPARVESLKQQWFSATGRLPGEDQLERMLRSELDRDMLFQKAIELELHRYDTVVYQRLLRNMRFLRLGEGRSDEELYRQALEMRLHLGDEVVKRRMIQVMEQLLLAGNPPGVVTESDLAAEFERRREELRHPPRYTLQHLYFNRQREPGIDGIVATIREQGLGPEQALQYSSPFLPGYRFVRQSPEQLARHFGAAFVLNLEQAGPVPGEWLGPIRSTYGLHYVWIEEIEPAREATLAEVRQRLERDLESQARTLALQQATARLRERYEVIL